MRKWFTIILIFFCSDAIAAPSIQSATGTFSQGESIVLSVNDPGSKSPAAPLRYIDFEDGTDGNAIPSNETSGGLRVASGVVYDDDMPRFSGDMCALQSYDDVVYNQTIGLGHGNDPPTGTITGTKLYMHCYWKIDLTGNSPRNAKFLNLSRIYGNGTDDWESRIDSDNNPCNPTPTMMTSLKGDCPQSPVDINYPGGWATVAGTDEQWHRLDSYLDLSAGTRDIYIDNALWTLLDIEEDGTDGCSDPVIGYVWFGHYWDNGACGQSDLLRWYSEIYIDISQARVEISDKSTWTAARSSGAHNEIQIPSAWSDGAPGSITFTFNQGAFAADNTAYIYVIDSNGNANSSGYEITIGSSGATSPTMSGVSLRGVCSN